MFELSPAFYEFLDRRPGLHRAVAAVLICVFALTLWVAYADPENLGFSERLGIVGVLFVDMTIMFSVFIRQINHAHGLWQAFYRKNEELSIKILLAGGGLGWGLVLCAWLVNVEALAVLGTAFFLIALCLLLTRN